MSTKRTRLQEMVAKELFSSGAINMEAVAKVLAAHGTEAAETGDTIGFIIGRHVMDLCIPVDFKDLLGHVNINQQLGTLDRG